MVLTRWASLALLLLSLLAWAGVSSLRLIHQGPSYAELAASGPPRRISDPTILRDEAPVNLRALRHADVALRITTAVLAGIHLILLNLMKAPNPR